MCGRYTLHTPMPDLAAIFGAETPGPAEPRYNVAPTDPVSVLRSRGRTRVISALRWGLVPNWSRGPSDVPLIINARSETLESKPAFRDLLASARCAVLADGFFEWRTELGLKQPYYVTRRDAKPMAFAGLADSWGELESCAIVTTDANQLLLPLHDRMPVVLDDKSLDRWLDREARDFEELRDTLRPAAPDLLEAYAVSPRVNRVADDDEGLIEPVDEPIRESRDWSDRPAAGSQAPDDQLGLF